MTTDSDSRAERGAPVFTVPWADRSFEFTDDDDLLTFQAILRRQDGVFRFGQVAPYVSWERVRRAVQAGRWRRAHRGVYVAHDGELTRRQELWVCLLAGPPDSALGGLTAAELDGLRGWEVEETYLVVPNGARRPARDGLVVKVSSALTMADVHPSRRPRRTRLPRSLVDGASWQREDSRARSVIVAGIQQGLAEPDDLSDALQRRAGCRHRTMIKQTIDDARGTAESLPGEEFRRIRRMLELPEPESEHVVPRADGHFYLAAQWPRYDVSVEIHGLPDAEVVTWDADLDRRAVMAARGRRMLQFSAYAVRHRARHVATLLAEALRHGGWPG